MRISHIAAAVLTLVGAQAQAASVTLAGLADSEDGFSYDVDARFSPTDSWSFGAGLGKSEAALTGADFSGTSLRLGTDLSVGAFSAGVSLQQWNDSNQIKSTGVLGQFGWMTDSGLSISALVDDRSVKLQYTTTVLGQIRERTIDFGGTGFGADVSWFGEQWTLGARYIDYDYGSDVDRLRAVLNSPNTGRFPRLQLLIASVVTRAAGAPDRQFAATLGRQFARSSLHGDWGMERDALTRTKFNSLSLTHGYRISPQVQIDTTFGFSDGSVDGTVAYGGLALTLRN